MRRPKAKRYPSISATDPHVALRDAISDLITVLAGPLLQAGIQLSEYSDLSKQAFVQAASERCRLKNGRINESRVAVVTGLSRQEIARIRAASGTGLAQRRMNSLDRIIEGWTTDPKFSENGDASILSVTHGHRSFSTLVRKYGKDVTTRAVLEELLASGMVKLRGESVLPTGVTGFYPVPARRAVRELMQHLVVILGVLTELPKGKRGRIYSVQLNARNEIEEALLRKKVELVFMSTFEAIRAISPAAKAGKKNRSNLRTVNILTVVGT